MRTMIRLKLFAPACCLSLLMFASVYAQQSSRGQITGTVRDATGAVLRQAHVTLISAQQGLIGRTETDAEGRFRFDSVAVGTYVVLASRPDFSPSRVAAKVSTGVGSDLNITLEINQLSEAVTVTAETGIVEDKDRVAQQVNVITEDALRLRTTDVLAQAADEEPGLALQRTSPTIGGIFVRGLTGKNVAVYVDGVRYTTSTQRGGISTFLNLNEPSSLRAIEVLRGPNSAQYGSDSLGGTVQLLTRVPGYGTDVPETHGEINTSFTSANLSFGGNTLLTYGTKHFGLLANLAGRRINTLRPAGGIDTHSALTRFLGLRSDILGSRLPDTAFTQYGGTLHLNYSPAADQQFIFHYQRSQQDGGKRYDQLLGGDGNLVADLRNLMLDFFYARYLKQDVGFFDDLSLTFSYNGQREERVNQGGQGNPLATITHQYERTNVYGLNFYLDKRFSRQNTFLIGGDVYHERVNAPAYTFNPRTNVFRLSRPRVPNRARYLSFGLYAQDIYTIVPEKLRLSAALRFNVASYLSRAINSPLVGGQPLFPDDSLRVDDFSGRVGAVYTVAKYFNISFNYSRGFHAPNITDLGTLGLTGDGFEADFTSATNLGGIIGTTAGRDALSTNLPVSQQRSETSDNFDLGFHFRRGRVRTELVGFLINVNDAIVKQSLILPPGSTGQFLGDQPIINQLPNGVVFVPLSTTPVLVRANFSDARLYGIEYSFDARLKDSWIAGGNFTYIRALDKKTGLPPNIEGGTPPATAFLRLRYQPAGKPYWIEGYSTLSGRQRRLSSLDLSDRRTGATRSRGQIADFFNNGARVRGLTGAGVDGVFGTADDRLMATNETLSEVQNRVLGSTNAAPMFTALPGYGLFNVRGGLRTGERSELSFDFENIGDKSYRNPSWGIDGPGRSVTLRYQYRF
ncbi:MAG TPA: TonB-dependent receptor [Pyrinomonadaceae bacterium]|nr:TonB-dependent receptor [Pyrinomonadaceae bacterium]